MSEGRELMYPDTTCVYDPVLRAVIVETWERLPEEARRSLKGVVFVQKRSLSSDALASAGVDDVWVRELKMAEMASADAIICHELGHIYHRHYEQLQTGQISREQAEIEADDFVRACGFAGALDVRRALLGR